MSARQGATQNSPAVNSSKSKHKFLTTTSKFFISWPFPSFVINFPISTPSSQPLSIVLGLLWQLQGSQLHPKVLVKAISSYENSQISLYSMAFRSLRLIYVFTTNSKDSAGRKDISFMLNSNTEHSFWQKVNYKQTG